MDEPDLGGLPIEETKKSNAQIIDDRFFGAVAWPFEPVAG
jgi:hypothetical protein